MKKAQKHSVFVRIAAMILIFALLAPVATSAATVQPRASDYLDMYSAYVYRPGLGRAQVYFSVTGTDYMDELGALTIKIYESSDGGTTWTWKKTFKHDTTSGMLSYNDDYHSGHVTYWGSSSKIYKAYVCIWGGKDGEGDTRYFWAYEV